MEIRNLELFDSLKINEGVTISRQEFLDKLKKLNKEFPTEVEPVNNVYGTSEIFHENTGILEKTYKDVDGKRYLTEYSLDGRLIKTRSKINDSSYKYSFYDDNGAVFYEKAYEKRSDNGSYNKVSEELKPNMVIKHDNITTITDSEGRVVKATALDIELNPNKKAIKVDKTNKGYLDNDHRGHIIPENFNGRNTLDNIVPQLDKVNQGKISQVENIARELKKQGKHVDYEMVVHYGDAANPQRPTSFEPKITVDGKVYQLDSSLKKIYNNVDLTSLDKVKTTINEKKNIIKHTSIESHGLGKEGAKMAATLTLASTTVEDIQLVIDGQMDVDDMVIDIVKDTATAGGLGYIEGFAEGAVCATMRKCGGKMISGLAKTGIPGMVIDFGIQSYGSVADYAEGKIDEFELLYDLGGNATSTFVAFEAAKMGALAGTTLGPVGSLAGGVVGGMVGCFIASEVYVAAVDAGVKGADIIADKAYDLGNQCLNTAREVIPESVDLVANSLNEFASNFDLPFSF